MTTSNFNYLNNDLRKKLGLTLNQMAVLSEITYRSWIPETFNWCTMSPKMIGEILSFTENEVNEAMSGLLIKGYIEHPDDVGEGDDRVRCSLEINKIKRSIDADLPKITHQNEILVSRWLARNPDFDANCVAILGYCLGVRGREIGRDEILGRLKIGKSTYYKCLNTLEVNGYCIRTYRPNYEKGTFGFNKSGHFFYAYPISTLEWESCYGFGNIKEVKQ